MAFDFIFTKVQPAILKLAIIAVIILPGIVQSIHLHPYEYIYYNSFIGGIEGAYRRFELDYWGLSFYQAGVYLNETLPQDTEVWIAGPTHLLFGRENLSAYTVYPEDDVDCTHYGVAMTRENRDWVICPDSPVLYQVQKDGAVFVVVKGPANP
jgi:hypothetical protein